MIDEELILYKLAERMASVLWVRQGDTGQARRFRTISRRVKHFSEVSSDMQPACYQAEYTTSESQRTGLPYKTVLEANWIIYHRAGDDPTAIPAIENNLIIGGVRQALAPLPTDVGFPDDRNTLGSLVHHCFIDGRIFKDPGDMDSQAMLVVPIKLLVP